MAGGRAGPKLVSGRADQMNANAPPLRKLESWVTYQEAALPFAAPTFTRSLNLSGVVCSDC